MLYTKPSRKEQRESTFLRLAEQGKMVCEGFSLFISEERALRKAGFDIKVKRIEENRKQKIPVIISWEKAFKDGVPLIVSDYITATTDTFPKWKTKNWAQELYVIAARANFKKAQKTIE